MTALARCAWHRCTPGNCSPANHSCSSRSSPRPLITATAGSHSSRMGKTACLQFQLREYQKRNWNWVPDAKFSASTAAKNSSKVIFLLWSKTSLALQNENAFVPRVPEQNNPEAKHLLSLFIAVLSTFHWVLIPKQVGCFLVFFLHELYILVQQNKPRFPKQKNPFFPPSCWKGKKALMLAAINLTYPPRVRCLCFRHYMSSCTFSFLKPTLEKCNFCSSRSNSELHFTLSLFITDIP